MVINNIESFAFHLPAFFHYIMISRWSHLEFTHTEALNGTQHLHKVEDFSMIIFYRCRCDTEGEKGETTTWTGGNLGKMNIRLLRTNIYCSFSTGTVLFFGSRQWQVVQSAKRGAVRASRRAYHHLGPQNRLGPRRLHGKPLTNPPSLFWLKLSIVILDAKDITIRKKRDTAWHSIMVIVRALQNCSTEKHVVLPDV